MGCYGIQVDEKGRVGEGAVCSALFVFEQEASSNGASNGTSPDEEVRHLVVATPRFDGTILAGTTAAAALALLNEASMLGASAFDQYLRPGETRVVVVDARQRDGYAAEAKEKAREMIFVAGDYKVHGVVRGWYRDRSGIRRSRGALSESRARGTHAPRQWRGCVTE